eukprot:2662391-Alexandrium_andersonii.AAC.1
MCIRDRLPGRQQGCQAGPAQHRGGERRDRLRQGSNQRRLDAPHRAVPVKGSAKGIGSLLLHEPARLPELRHVATQAGAASALGN